MKGEEQSAERVLVSYIAAQLQSGMVTIEAAQELGDVELLVEAVRKYGYLAEVARQFYTDHSSIHIGSTKSHNWKFIQSELRQNNSITWQRHQQLPHIAGEATVQLALFYEIWQFLGCGKLILTFRQRGEDLVLRCMGNYKIPAEILVAGHREALVRAAHQPSLASIQGYLLNRRCAVAAMRIVVAHGLVYLHFQVLRQLKIEL